MKCPKCGAEINDNSVFCSFCGEKIENLTVMVEEVQFEEVHYVDEQNPESNKNKFYKIWNSFDKKEKIMAIVIVVLVLMSTIAFIAGKVFSGVVALISLLLVLFAFFVKKQIIKSKSKIKTVAVILAFVLVIPYFFGLGNYSDAEKFKWDILEMSEVVPEPDVCFGEIMSNQDDYCSVYIHDVDENEFVDYMKKCKEEGFVIDAERSDDNFEAFNSIGYKLSLFYSEYDKEMHITVEAPEKYDTFEWSEKCLGKLIPVPKSKVGKIEQDDATDLIVYVAEMKIEDFKGYIKQCSDVGFTFEKSESSKIFSAKNKDSYKLTVEYVGNNVIKICLSEPEYTVDFEVHCNQNLMFSQYDVDVYFEDYYEGTVEHGMTEEFTVSAVKGKYDIKFVSAEDDEVTGVAQVEITKNETLELEISCTSSAINVEVVKGSEVKTTKTGKETTTKKEKDTEKDTEEVTEKEETRPVFYSTNDYETAKKGNTGVFSYVNKGKLYDNYYIIDFDEGYVYWFTDGNNEDFCDRLKIESGDLNTNIKVTYHDGDDEWSYKFHFKYVNHPETLIMVDQNGFDLPYTTTDLDDALAIRRTKQIYNY